jgi:hypothetical protein
MKLNLDQVNEMIDSFENRLNERKHHLWCIESMPVGNAYINKRKQEIEITKMALHRMQQYKKAVLEFELKKINILLGYDIK